MSTKAEVIDLSSDDETEPAPPIESKPVPNAMVHIPQQLQGVTIKTIKGNPLSIQKALAGKPVTLTKVLANPYATKSRPNGRQTQPGHLTSIISIPKLPKTVGDAKLVRLHKVFPFNQKTPPITNSGIIINSQYPGKKMPAKFLINPIQIQSPNTLNKLPPSITVTRTTGAKRPVRPGVSNVLRKRPRLVPKNTGEVLTVDLDDDEVAPPTTSGPQWYVRPEDQKELEEQNNKEPEPNLIEITIEDSPVKPVNKRAFEVGTELAITIDDSPKKTVKTTKTTASGSDEEEASTSKEPHSKKKLEYPSSHKIGDTFELEIVSANEPAAVDTTADKTEEVQSNDDNVVLIQESPTKSIDNFQTSTPKKKKVCTSTEMEKKVECETTVSTGEFHPVYQSFIDLCFKLENSDDMKKIVEKKIKAYYRQTPKEYTESEEFIDMISSKIVAMNAGPQKMYLYIKDIVDELNIQRKSYKTNIVSKEVTEEAEKFLYGEDSEFDAKRQRQIRKLEKTLKKLHRAIQKLEEQEVDFDDEEDSVYLLTESVDGCTSIKDIDNPLERKEQLLKRYKERMVRVHAKFCQLTNTKMPSELRVPIEALPGRPKGPAKRLEKWINKKVPIGTALPFPDFHDVLRCVKEANEEDNLGWNDADIMEEARDLFTRCGKKLQRRRQENEWRLAASRIQAELDPAESSEELRKKLDQNLQIASKKESEVFNKFAERQKQLKLEAVEIGDKEADESPVESEDDDVCEETISLETKEKRKERLKRLLEEKSIKTGDGKENKPDRKAESTTSQAKDDADKEFDDVVKAAEKGDILINRTRVKNNIVTQERRLHSDKPHSVSDDSNVGSDIDELHLLQKLHSTNENVSSAHESSDSESPIAISDSIDSGSDNKYQSDVISIENSIFSESEMKDDLSMNKIVLKTEPLVENMDTNTEIECSSDGIQKILNKSNNDEYNESIENILLASSDDEAGTEAALKPDSDLASKVSVSKLKNDKIGETSQSKEKSIETTTSKEDIISSKNFENVKTNIDPESCDSTDASSEATLVLEPPNKDNIVSSKDMDQETSSQDSLQFVPSKDNNDAAEVTREATSSVETLVLERLPGSEENSQEPNESESNDVVSGAKESKNDVVEEI